MRQNDTDNTSKNSKFVHGEESERKIRMWIYMKNKR